MTDLRQRAPARSLMERLVSLLGSDEIVELPLGILYLRPRAMNWLRGIRGELFMAAELAKLDSRWQVMHSVLVGERGDIDHLVIGPAGVFPINTKRLVDRDVRVNAGTFRSDEWAADYLRKAADECDRVVQVLNRNRLSAPVLPIIAISGARSVKVKATPQWRGRNIGVAEVREVVKRMRKRAEVVSPEQVARIADALSDSTVWSHRKPSAVEDAELVRAYRRIDRGVVRLRFAVLGVGGTIFAVLIWVCVAVLTTNLVVLAGLTS